MLPKSTNIETLKINLTNPIFGLRNGEYYINYQTFLAVKQ